MSLFDLADVSPTVGAIDSFEFFRAFVDEHDDDAKMEIQNAIASVMEEVKK